MKKVHAYVIRAANTIIDFVIQSIRNRREDVNEKIVAPLRREDHEEPIIPRIFRYGVGE